MLETLVKFAKTIRNFLGIAALIILSFVALFLWLFSRGSFDPIISNISVLDREQFFWLILVSLSLIFVVLIIIIILSFSASKSRRHTSSPNRISVIVHEDGDETLGIEGASVTLSLTPEPQEKISDTRGSAIFFYSPHLAKKKVKLNARKSGYTSRSPKNISLANEAQVYISLTRQDPLNKLENRAFQSEEQQPVKDQLKLVPVNVIERKPFPIIDVKLLNQSQNSLIIHKIDLVVLSSEPSYRKIGTSPPITTSHVYHILLDSIDTKSVSRNIAFEVRPHSADRFHLVVGAPGTSIMEIMAGLAVRDLKVACKLGLHYDNEGYIESEAFNLIIEIDPHFSPDKEASILDINAYIDEIKGEDERDTIDTELIDILGRLKIDKSQDFFLDRIRSGNFIISTEAAVALARSGHSLGFNYLRNWSSNKRTPTWHSVLCLRGLIRCGYIDPHPYILAIRDHRIPMKLEAVPMLGFLKEASIVPELLAMLKERDKLAITNLEFYSIQRDLPSDIARDAKENWEVEQIVKALGLIGDERGVDSITSVLEDSKTYRELSYHLLVTSIEALAEIGGTRALQVLDQVRSRIEDLDGSRNRVISACDSALAKARSSHSGGRGQNAPQSISEHDEPSLIVKREEDDFGIMSFEFDSTKLGNNATHTEGQWFRVPPDFDEQEIDDYLDRNKGLVTGATHLHFHNTIPPYVRLKDVDCIDRVFDTDGMQVENFAALAQKLLPGFKDRFLKGLPEGHTLYVTVVFKNDIGEGENAFIRVDRWEGKQIYGTIATMLRIIPQHSPGESITISDEQAIDWTLVRPDGSEEGNFVGKYIEQSSSKR